MNRRIFHAADLYLPQTDPQKWSVVACDQFTSQPEYWQAAAEAAGDAPSALHVVLPEVYLGQNEEGRIADINATMHEYLQNGVLKEYKNAMIYVQRQTVDGLRRGLVGVIDLAAYDYHAGADSLIRATEQTVLERIPPRVRIRRDAALELPHVLLLIDDPDGTVIEPLDGCDGLQTAYEFDLMLDGGHIKGSFLDEQAQQQVLNALDKLQQTCRGLLFAVGDGNHSLATAKECAALNDFPAAQQALVELVNIHDESLIFEPIYRVIFDADTEALLDALQRELGAEQDEAAQTVTAVTADGQRTLRLRAAQKLTVGTLQSWLDAYLKQNPALHIDYIHGEEVVRELCKQKNTVGFLFEGMKKEELFEAVRCDGALPRKTFSMGHAKDKRYYMEARRIRG